MSAPVKHHAALAARLAEVEAENAELVEKLKAGLSRDDDRVEQLQRRLAEVEAERDEAVKLAYERIEKQNVETGKRVDLIHEREAFRAERDRLAQELESAVWLLRQVEEGWGDGSFLWREACEFLARFPREGDEG